MYRILVVDDDESIRSIIKKYASFEGHTVFECADGMTACEMCRNEVFDIIIMDVMMPELDGFSACRIIRKFCSTPIIMLSARGEEYDRIHGFELGIDDYVVKPFSPRELMMRINAVINRSANASKKPVEEIHDIYEYSGLKLDFTARTVIVDGQRIEMTPKEYDLLFYLARNKGIALSRDRLLNEIWGFDYFKDDRTLDTHIKLVRKKIGAYSHCIVTVRGVGYRFEEA